VLTAALMLLAAAAAGRLQPAAAQHTSPGATFQTSDSTADIMPLQIPDAAVAAAASAAAAAAAAASAPSSKAFEKWWETDSDQDDSTCSVAYAQPSRVVGLKSHTTSRACARICRSVAPVYIMKTNLRSWLQEPLCTRSLSSLGKHHAGLCTCVKRLHSGGR